LPAGIALLFLFTSRLLENSRPSWFVGVRTPWTLSSKLVWKKTNALGAKLFKACAVASLLGLFAPQYAWLFVVAPALACAVALVAYSYVQYGREKKAGKRKAAGRK
jgi:uncharacterized membrane protein